MRYLLLTSLLVALAGCFSDPAGPSPDSFACAPGGDTLAMVTVHQGVYPRQVPLCLYRGTAPAR